MVCVVINLVSYWDKFSISPKQERTLQIRCQPYSHSSFYTIFVYGYKIVTWWWHYAVGILWSGIQYTSKLDEFVNFIEKIRKYGLIPSSSSEDAKPSIILLIDDLPMMNGRVAFERLQSCLLHLVRSTQLPTAILVSDYDEADSVDHTARRLEQLQLSLENAGACKVTFENKFNVKIEILLFLNA